MMQEDNKILVIGSVNIDIVMRLNRLPLMREQFFLKFRDRGYCREKKLKLLIATNYKGYLSLEYERRWHPNDLPESSKGMAFGSKHIRECIDQLVEL
jgi:hypothetical protein